jgi:hypothetical protein
VSFQVEVEAALEAVLTNEVVEHNVLVCWCCLFTA